MSEIKYNFNVAPYYDSTNEELEKNYVQYLAVDGQRLQNRELNVAQGLIRGNLRKITDIIIEDGSVVSGCNFTNDSINEICTLYEGEVYINGVIVKIPYTQWTYSQVPENMARVYANILPIVVTPTDDASLYNPAENYESFGNPGGHRLKYLAVVGIANEEDYNELVNTNKYIVSLINLKDRETCGATKSKPLFGKIATQLNQRTYDASGDFIAEGLNVTALRHSDNPLNKYEVHISKGRCYIKGEMYSLSDTVLKVDNNSINVNSTVDKNTPEEHIYSTSDINYYLNHEYVKNVVNVSGGVIITGLSVITIGNTDDIAPSGYTKEKIIDIDKVYTISPNVIYVKKDATNALTGQYDYEAIGSKIIWNTTTPVNTKPATSFYVDFIYNKELTNLTDYYFIKDATGYYIKFVDSSSNKLKAGLTFEVNYSWYMPRIDLVYINNLGVPMVKYGLATDETELTEPVVPAGSLPLAVIKVIPNTEPYNFKIRSFNLYRVPVGQLQDIKKRINNLEYDVVMSNLETQMQNKHLSTDTKGSYSLRNIYTDPVVDYTRTETTSDDFSATIDIFKNAIYMPMEIEQLGCDKADFIVESYDELNNKIYTKIDPIENSIISANVNSDIYAVSSQLHATSDIDITPYYYKGLLPSISCDPNKLVYIEDDSETKTVWLPNRIVYSTNYVDSIVKSNSVGRVFVERTNGEGIRTNWKNTFEVTTVNTTTTTTKETSTENVEVTKSAVSLVSQPYMKSGQSVTVKGRDFAPNTEIRLYLDEKIVTAEFTNTRYNETVEPITTPVVNGTTIDPTLNNITYVYRPWQWAFNKDVLTGMWKLHHPLYNGHGIEYYYNKTNKNWFYKILGYHTTVQSLASAPAWSKVILRSPWIQDYIDTLTDTDIINEITTANMTDVTTETTYTTNYSDAKITVITDNNGEFEVEISIPENTPVGTHIITAKTVLPENFDPDYYKETSGSFIGESYLRHWDTTVYKRIVENIKTTVYNEKVITTYRVRNSATNTTRDGNGRDSRDPIAQTFKLSSDQFLTGIDLYFSRIPDASDTITQPWIAIREVENGVPSDVILYEQFIDKSIIVDADDSVTGIKASIPTYIKFNNPIYIEANKEYAFTIGANQDGYHIYYSSIGNTDVSTGESVLYQKQQSESGVMLVSSNNSTWTAMQDSDVKYTLYRTDYNTTIDKVIYIDNITTKLPNFSSLNMSIANTIYENTSINVYYTVNTTDIYSSSTSWKQMTLEELIEFSYSDEFNSAMQIAFKIVISTDNSQLSPMINLGTFELFLGKYLSRGTYTQLAFDINY